jgi:hypothetical protein
MKEEVEDVQRTSIGYGLYKIPNGASYSSSKVLQIFNKLKRESRDAEIEPNLR